MTGGVAPVPRSPLQRAAWRYGHMWSGLLAAFALEIYVLTNAAPIIGITITIGLIVAMVWHLVVMMTAMEALQAAAGEVVSGPRLLSTRVGRWVAANQRIALLPTWAMEVLAPFALIAGIA